MFIMKKCVQPLVLVRFSSNYAAQVLLSNENRKNCMRKFQAMSVKQETNAATRQAAVLIPICVKDNRVSLLYTLRAADLKSHRGQVSFPGGMYDDCDKTLEQTALRETHEELGINPKNIVIWGRGNFITRSDLNILPIVGCLKTDISSNDLTLNINEVEDVFTVTVDDLCNPNLCRYTQFRGSYSAPAYFGGAHRVWGLTAVITYMFLKAFLPANMHKHNLPFIPNVQSIIKKEL